ncbi:MAG: futalosine hydrolase [Planctomycetota bacterium]
MSGDNENPTSALRQSHQHILIVVAAPAEATAILGIEDLPAQLAGSWVIHPIDPRTDLLLTGVGKANASAGLAKTFDADRHRVVLSLGIGGSTDSEVLPIGAAALARRSLYADEGLRTADAWRPLGLLGFPPSEAGDDGVPGHAGLAGLLGPMVDAEADIATVSSCSGTDELSARLVRETGAGVEAMEGAAVGHTLCRLLGTGRPPFAEIRVISNRTGDREKQGWDLPRALDRLAEIGRGVREKADELIAAV